MKNIILLIVAVLLTVGIAGSNAQTETWLAAGNTPLESSVRFVVRVDPNVTQIINNGSLSGSGIYLYNDSISMYLNETRLNETIDYRIVGLSESDPYWTGNYTACSSSQKLYFDASGNLACNDDQVGGGGTGAPHWIDGGVFLYPNTTYADNIRVYGWIEAINWSNVSITESQISDLSHTVESDPYWTANQSDYYTSSEVDSLDTNTNTTMKDYVDGLVWDDAHVDDDITIDSTKQINTTQWVYADRICFNTGCTSYADETGTYHYNETSGSTWHLYGNETGWFKIEEI